MADLLSREDYRKLTGKTIDSDRYSVVLSSAVARLEKLLGWPLDPDTWENLYLETGKARSDGACPDVDADDLDDPDPLPEGHKFRLYRMKRTNKWLATDPFTEIHSIKLVRDTVACKTLTDKEFRVEWKGGPDRFAKYIQLTQSCWDLWNYWRDHCGFRDVQVAVDADWAFAPLEIEGSEIEADFSPFGAPADLKQVLADMVSYEADPKKGIQSESLESHSYTKRPDGDDPQLIHAPTLQAYAGPNSILNTKRKQV